MRIMFLLITALVGCGRMSDRERIALERDYVARHTPPGVEIYTWEEPMVDVIEVPAGLDPQGVYYRPQHQQIIEIRQGRWKYQDR